MRAKVAQEKLIKASGVPYTILRATQFFEFLGAIAGAAALADVAVGSPATGEDAELTLEPDGTAAASSATVVFACDTVTSCFDPHPALSG